MGRAHRFLHSLHYDQHRYQVGDRNPGRKAERGLRIPELIEPTALWSADWQSVGATLPARGTLFDFVNLMLK